MRYRLFFKVSTERDYILFEKFIDDYVVLPKGATLHPDPLVQLLGLSLPTVNDWHYDEAQGIFSTTFEKDCSDRGAIVVQKHIEIRNAMLRNKWDFVTATFQFK